MRIAGRQRALAFVPILLAACVTLQAQTIGAGSMAEPTVSRREARALEEAQALAATNAPAAIVYMETQSPRDSGAAWHFTLGNLYVETERLPEAEQAYGRALDVLPDFRAAKINLGRVHLLREQPEKAMRIYLDLAQSGQADADVLLLLGHALLMREHWLSAENAYRQALLLKPGEPEALRGLAQCLMRQERLREAHALLTEWLATEPNRKELWAFLANIRLALDNPDGALVALESARRLGYADADMLATLGDLYMNREQYGDAMARYTDSFSDADLPVDRLLRAARAYVGADRLDEAERLLATLATRRETSDLRLSAEQRREQRRIQAELALLRDDAATAIRIGIDLLKESPMDARGLMMMGEAYQRADETEKAVIAYERAARLPGHEAPALIRHAQIEIERERYGKATKLLEAAQQFDPQPHVARYLEQVKRLVEGTK